MLQFPMLPLEYFLDMPASEVVAGIVSLPQGEVLLLAMEAHQPFMKVRGTMGVVERERFQTIGDSTGAAVNQTDSR